MQTHASPFSAKLAQEPASSHYVPVWRPQELHFQPTQSFQPLTFSPMEQPRTFVPLSSGTPTYLTVFPTEKRLPAFMPAPLEAQNGARFPAPAVIANNSCALANVFTPSALAFTGP